MMNAASHALPPVRPEPERGSGAPHRPLRFPSWQTRVERRDDGTLVLRAATASADPPFASLPDYLRHWADARGAAPAFRERDAAGAWRTLEWAELWRQVQVVGAALLELGLGPERPLMVLSGNSLEQLVLLLAAEYVGVATAPVSPAYSLASQDHVRLKGVAELVPPAALFVQSGRSFARALSVLRQGADIPVIAVQDVEAGQRDWASLASGPLSQHGAQRAAQAHARLRPEQTARILFTSGSTGVPKGVPLSHANLRAVAAYFAEVFAAVAEPPAVFLDWLPWHHVLGGVSNLSRTIVLGGVHHLDDGRPLPGHFARTVRNLREVSPTVFSTVPSAWTMLCAELEDDPALARSLFARVVNFGYGGASLPGDVLQRIARVAERTVGERIAFCTGLATTETSCLGTFCGWLTDAPGNIGVPVPGMEAKLVPVGGNEGRYEIRLRGPSVFSGYIGRPDLTAAAFDEEGYFRLGDAVRLADPADPARGMVFAGRVAEDFKLANGTWVRTGAARLDVLERCAPLLSDAVICGHDRDFLAALAWPDLAACRALSPELAGLDAPALVRHPEVVAALGERLGRAGGGAASQSVRRVLLMAEPPSLDAGEIADKGYVNQAATRQRRAHLIDELYQPQPGPHVAAARHVAGAG